VLSRRPVVFGRRRATAFGLRLFSLHTLACFYSQKSPSSSSSSSAETWRVGVLVMPSGAVPEGRGRSLQPKSAGLPGITRQRVGLPLKIFRLNSLLLLLLLLDANKASPPPPPPPPPPKRVTASFSFWREHFWPYFHVNRFIDAPSLYSLLWPSLYSLRKSIPKIP